RFDRIVMHVLRGRGRFAVLVFAPLLLALFPGVFLRGEVFYDRDLHVDFFPQAEAFVRAVFASAWPLWDSTVSFGQPLLADPSAMVLYPPHWLNLLLSPWRYYVVFVVAHVLFTAEGARRLGARLGLSTWAAVLGGALWVASGPLQSLVSAWHHFAGAAWMPWVLLAALNALAEPASRRTRLWALAQAGQLLAGSAEMTALTVALTGLAAATLPSVASRSARLRTGAVALGLAIALAAAVWLPAAELVSHSARRGLPETSRALWSLHPARLLEIVAPVRWHESGGPPAPLQLPREPTPPFLASVYLGAMALVLAGAGLSRPGASRLWLALSVVGPGLVALGPHTPFYGALVTLVPPLGFFRYPTKAWPAVGLAIALLAGRGWDALRAVSPGQRERRWRAILGAAPLLFSTATVWLTLRAGPVGPGSTDPRLRAALGLILAAMAYVIVLRGGARLAPLLGLLAVADLAWAHHDLNKTTPASILAFRPAFVDALQMPDRSRLYVYDYTGMRGRADLYLGHEPFVLASVPPELGLARSQALSLRLYPFPPTSGRWGIESSFDLDARRLYPDFLSQLVLALRGAEGTDAHLRLLRVGAVAHVAALHKRGFEDLRLDAELPTLFPEKLYVFSVPGHMPRAYAVGRARVAADAEALRLLATGGIDPSREIVLATDAGPAAETPPSDPEEGRVEIVGFRSDRVLLSARMPAPGFVVLVDTWDPGWRVTVDDREATLLRANLAFRAVAVPAGEHRIEMRYRPRSVMAGAMLSAVAAALLIGLAASARRRPDPAQGGHSAET
ncbi:MAG TPA: YfhO family protein, partial [Vicinamibacteria bacterium]|nr:YfhO family protein [Vicinamibacteria bacterium]